MKNFKALRALQTCWNMIENFRAISFIVTYGDRIITHKTKVSWSKMFISPTTAWPQGQMILRHWHRLGSLESRLWSGVSPAAGDWQLRLNARGRFELWGSIGDRGDFAKVGCPASSSRITRGLESYCHWLRAGSCSEQDGLGHPGELRSKQLWTRRSRA